MKSIHYSIEIKRKWSNVQKETGLIQNKSIKSKYHCILNDIISKPQHIAKTVVKTIRPTCRLDWSLFGVWLSRRMNMLLMAFCAFVVDKNHKQDERIVSKYPLLLTTVLQVNTTSKQQAGMLLTGYMALCCNCSHCAFVLLCNCTYY